MDTTQELELLIKSRYPIVYFETMEEDRAESIVAAVAGRLKFAHYSWTVTEGLKRYGYPDPVYDTCTPIKVLNNIGLSSGTAIYLLKDFHRYLDDPVILRKFKDVARAFGACGSTIIISAAELRVPSELEKQIAHLELKLPDESEIRGTIERTLNDFVKDHKVKFSIDTKLLDRFVCNLKGLTLFEIERALSRVLLKGNGFDEKDLGEILKAKKEIVEKDGLLEYYLPDGDLASIGGMDNLKSWLEKRKCVFTQRSAMAKLGLEAPKGVMVMGVQGCGKSLFAKTVSREWGLPLLKLDPGVLYSKYLGESEANLRKALAIAESMAPLVLWIDEIEKGFSFSASAEGDAGVSKRIFGTFLTWLQEKQADIFIVATSNDISQLPPELLRKGRFDEIFFVDLPGRDIRREIFRIHLAKRTFDPSRFDLDALADAADGFNGAEIEQAIISALYGAVSLKKDLSTQLIQDEIASTKPLSVTMKEKIDFLREWARDRAVIA